MSFSSSCVRPFRSSRLRIRPEPVPGEMDEHVFERRLAERDRFDPVRKRLDQPRQSTDGRSACSSRTEPSTTFAVALELPLDVGGQRRRIVRANRDRIAAHRGLQRRRRIERGQVAAVHDRDSVGPLRLLRADASSARTVTPSASRTCSRYCHKSLRAPGSSPVDGSSSNNSRGRCSMPVANSTRRRKPPESCLDQLAPAIGKAQPGEHFVGPSPQLAAAKAVQPAVVNRRSPSPSASCRCWAIETRCRAASESRRHRVRRSWPRMRTSPC